jgi:2'-5' RNA ligase
MAERNTDLESERDEEQSALLLLVPAAELAVREHRARLDLAAREGVPAHFTVLYPFLPPSQIRDADLSALGRLFAGVSSFDFILDRIGWFGEQVVWLGPRDSEPFRALTVLTYRAFPDYPPYGGQYADGDVTPHLTIGHDADLDVLRAAADSVREHLPIGTRATEVTLMAGPKPGAPGTPGTPPGTWRRIAAFPLA